MLVIKNLPAKQETQVLFLGWENPLEKKMTAHSRISALEIRWTEEPDELQSTVSQRVGHDWNNLACSETYIRNFCDFLKPDKV